jgi:penicillin amidase
MHKAVRFTVRLLAVLVILAALAVLAALWVARGSLAQLDGERALPGLSAPVSIERDALGVATIDAANEVDAARALGFLHAQERYFEMDLMRRAAAGELSELFGPLALEHDRQARLHRLRARVDQFLPEVAGDSLPVMQAYAEGANAGLAALASKPWAYWLLGTEPAPWTAEDTALVGYAMFFDLQDEMNTRELALWRIRQVLPAPLYALLTVDGSEWDAPMLGEVRGNAVLPGPDEVDLRSLPFPDDGGDYPEAEPAAPGSNNFAVAGALTAHGHAIVANDMHLGLRAPALWFRARLRYVDPRTPDGRVDVTGFTLPGIPAVIVGSNGHVAWGFTNSYGDWADFYRVHWLDEDRLRYRVPEGEAAARRVSEWIQVKGSDPVELKVTETRWGPVTVDLEDGSSLALRWTAQLPGALNFGLAGMVRARSLDEGLAVADVAGIPGQNLVIGDREGRIAWRLTAQMPARSGDCDLQVPLEPEQACRWTGWLAPTENPSVVDPADGRVWTANARVVDGEALALVGDAGYANGARARQIRDDLFAREQFSEADLLAIQLDDRALFLERWHRLLQEAAAASPDADLQALAAAARDWEGRASPEAVSYRLVRAWRLKLIDRLREGLLAPATVALGEDRPAAVRGGGLAAAAGAAGAPAAAPLRELGGLAGRSRRRGARRTRGARSAAGAQLGRAQHRPHLPSAGQWPARLPARSAVHAGRSAAGRQQHAAGAVALLRRQPAHGGGAGTRVRRPGAHARRPERPPALALLGRRPCRLGGGPALALPARARGPHPEAPP